jgi:hypothetical protein
MALGSTQPLTGMSTGNICWGLKAACPYSLQTCHLHVQIVNKSRILRLLERLGPVQACTGIAVPIATSDP